MNMLLKLVLAGTIGWGILSQFQIKPAPVTVHAREAKSIEFTWEAIEAKVHQVDEVRRVTGGFATNMPERVWAGRWF